MDDAIRRTRVVTWNIHGCVGRDGRYDVERIGACIQAISPDIAAFQEVDSRGRNPGQSEVGRYLREQVGDHGHEAWSISGPDGRYGQMLASRFPLEDRHVHDISMPGREPRKVMEARVVGPAGPLRLVATHLGLRPAERRRQVAKLRDILSADLASPLILLGDFNEWRGRRIRRDAPSDVFGVPTSHATFPSRFPFLALDRIYCRPGGLMAHSRVVREAAIASDHLPLVADIDVAARTPRSI